MAKSRRKKSEKKDFKKVKLRVGRKVAKGNETKLSFVAKKICLREEAERGETVVSSSHVLFLSTILPRLSSRRNDDLVVALGELRTWMRQQPEDARQLLLLELPSKVAPLVRHLDAKVRGAAVKAFTTLLQLTHDLPAYHPALAQAMFGALLHFDTGVRETGWDLLRQMLDVAPRVLAGLNSELLLQELGRRLPGEACAGSATRGARLLRTVERLVQTLDPVKQLHTSGGPLSTSDLARPFRGARFDFQPCALKALWRSDHVPRAAEQGLGWEGPGRLRLADFLGELSGWLLSLCKEFANLDSALRAAEGRSRLVLLPRLLSLLSLLTAALQLHLRQPLPAAPLRTLSDGAALLWRLFPVPRDAALFSGKPPAAPLRLNLALVRLHCALPRDAAGPESDDAALLGAFFNDEMGPLWPLPRWLCLQWVACAEVAALTDRGAAWSAVLDSAVQRIAAVQPEGSKVAEGCARAAAALERAARRRGGAQLPLSE